MQCCHVYYEIFKTFYSFIFVHRNNVKNIKSLIINLFFEVSKSIYAKSWREREREGERKAFLVLDDDEVLTPALTSEGGLLYLTLPLDFTAQALTKFFYKFYSLLSNAKRWSWTLTKTIFFHVFIANNIFGQCSYFFASNKSDNNFTMINLLLG